MAERRCAERPGGGACMRVERRDGKPVSEPWCVWCGAPLVANPPPAWVCFALRLRIERPGRA